MPRLPRCLRRLSGESQCIEAQPARSGESIVNRQKASPGDISNATIDDDAGIQKDGAVLGPICGGILIGRL